jgi:hypothetical protein
MRTTHISAVSATAAVTLCLAMAPAAGFAGQQRQSQKVHDNLSNADYTASIDANGNAVLTVKAGDFFLEKAVDSSGNFTLRLTQGKDIVSIVSNSAGYLVSHGKRAARFDPRVAGQAEARDAVRAVLLGSPAVRSFRRLSVVLENRDEREDESPMTLSALVDGAIVQMLDGDPGAVPRIAKRVIRAQRARLRTVRFRAADTLKDCVGMYERALLESWNQAAQCMEWADGVHWYFEDWAQGFCYWEWIARSQQYIYQFISCMALPF